MSNCWPSRPPQHQKQVHARQVLLAYHPKGFMKLCDESSCSKRLRRSRSPAELPWRISLAGFLRSPPLLLAHDYGESLGVRSLGQAREQGSHGARTYSDADSARLAGESRQVVAARHWHRLDRQVVAHQRDMMVPRLSWKKVPGVAPSWGKESVRGERVARTVCCERPAERRSTWQWGPTIQWNVFRPCGNPYRAHMAVRSTTRCVHG
jgi:hypothetical protein